MITSDTIGSNEDTALLNRIRRIDGEEFLFITDIKSALHILQHFQSRLYELEKASQGKVQLQQFKDELLSLSQKFAQMAKS